MRHLPIAAMSVLLLSTAQAASAQEVRGFAFGSGTTLQYDQQYPGFGGGVLVELGQPWLAVGAQGEAFSSWPYFAGRGSVFAEGRLLPKSAIVPLVLGGAGFGEYGGPMVGGGVEIRVPRSRVAFRITVEDFMLRDTRYDLGQPAGTETHHQVATRFGVSF
jgi:hypothetical protein